MSFIYNAVIPRILVLFLAFSTITGIWKAPEVPNIVQPEAVETLEITADYVIVTAGNATAAEHNAAVILQKYLKDINGNMLDIVLDSDSYNKEIVVGITSREGSLYSVDRTALSNEGVFIKTVDDTIIITGGSQRGTLYAIYTFLEDYLGCRWFAKDVTYTPTADKILIPKTIDFLFIPQLEYRATNWVSTREADWSVAHKLNALTFSPLDDESLGGGVGYIGFAHSLQGSLIKLSDYEAFPETKALGAISGVRTTEHPCLSEEKTYEIVLDNVFRLLEQYPKMQIISVTQPDNSDYCVCDACKAVYAEEGSPSGLMVRFTNRIADAVLERYPERDISVDTFAYTYTRQAPAITVPRDNVVIRLCSAECCFAHALNDDSCRRNVEFMKDLSEWKKICNRIYVWDYTTNFVHYNGPFNNWATMQKNLQVFTSNNVIGVFEEGNAQASECNGEFGDLRAYILAKVLWDPNTDVDKHLVEFCNAYYGDAGDYMVKYIKQITKRTGKDLLRQPTHFRFYEKMDNKGVMQLGLNDVTYIDNLWADAKSTTTLSEDQLFRVRLSEISWRYWKAHNNKREFSAFQFEESAKLLYADMKELGITRIQAGGPEYKLSDNPDFKQPPGEWKVIND